MSVQPPIPALEHAFDVHVEVGPPVDYGVTRAGHRRVVPILGGTISGLVSGEIIPGGADWQLLRADGTLEIDCRYSAQTTDGELLYLQVAGVRSGPPAILESLFAGDAVDPARYYFRTGLRIETAAPRLTDLQDAIFVASCVRDATAVRYAAYRVS